MPVCTGPVLGMVEAPVQWYVPSILGPSNSKQPLFAKIHLKTNSYQIMIFVLIKYHLIYTITLLPYLILFSAQADSKYVHGYRKMASGQGHMTHSCMLRINRCVLTRQTHWCQFRSVPLSSIYSYRKKWYALTLA